MPLLKKKPFPLIEPPKDLRAEETVWQVRFTKEIFKSYSLAAPHSSTKSREYLERVNLFRHRVWTCKATGKMHLTYEEALVSEQLANERLLQFPKEFMAHVLHIIQFSMLKMSDLVTTIVEKLRDMFVQGEELLGRSENSNCPCKVMKMLVRNGGTSYEVGWLNETREVISTTTEEKENLIRKKLPFSRGLLKLLIKESTFQNSPWVIHNNLAKDYGIPTEPPCTLRDKITKNQDVKNMKASKKKRTNMENDNSTATKTMKKIKTDQAHDQTSKTTQREKQPQIEKVKYPIEDLLVKPSADDPVFTMRPVPSVKFLIPMENVGNLLMVWDFLSCFGKLLHLSPFSLDEFENAIAYEGVSNLIAEAHTAILTLLINDHGEYYSFIQQKKRKETIMMKIWVQYLCDFLELENRNKLTDHVTKIKDGKYYVLSVHVKLKILGALLYWAISTEAIRGQLDKCIEQQQALVASKREEDMEESRKRREEKLLKQKKVNDNESLQENDDLKSFNEPTSDYMHHHVQKDLLEDGNKKVSSSLETKHLGNRGSKLEVLTSRRALMKKSLETKIAMEREKESSRMEELKRLQEENKARRKKAGEKKLKEQRLEHFERKMEKLHIRINSLGKDRDHNTYWFFPREGRVFVESADHSLWGFYSSKEALDALMGSLNPKGDRELALQRHLEKHYLKICSEFQKRSKEMAQRVGLEDTAILRRSIRVSALPKDENKMPSFCRYVNKWRRH